MSEINYTTHSPDYVLVVHLASEWGQSTSNIRKWLIKQGFKFLQVRGGKENGYQPMIALSLADADRARAFRFAQGYSGENIMDTGEEAISGNFYVIQIVPDLNPNRVKLGYATELTSRLSQYHTLSPTACVLFTQPCEPTWERAAIDSVTRVECNWLGGEVYDCESLDSLIERVKAFFALMPI